MKKKIGALTLSSVIAASLLPATAFADFTDADAFFSGGLGATVIAAADYYEDPSISSLGYSYFTANARADYAGISSANIGFLNVGNYTNAEIRFYAGSYGDDWYGKMQPYKSDGTQASMSDTWAKAHVWLNDALMDEESFSNTLRHETTIHELGHALSLLHQYTPTDSVMVDVGFQEITNPADIDVDNLQWKY